MGLQDVPLGIEVEIEFGIESERECEEEEEDHLGILNWERSHQRVEREHGLDERGVLGISCNLRTLEYGTRRAELVKQSGEGAKTS